MEEEEEEEEEALDQRHRRSAASRYRWRGAGSRPEAGTKTKSPKFKSSTKLYKVCVYFCDDRHRLTIGSILAALILREQPRVAAPPLPPAASRPTARNGNVPTKRTPTDENVDPIVATATSTSRPPGPVVHRPRPAPVLRSTQSRLLEPITAPDPSDSAELPPKGRKQEGDDGGQSAWDSDFEEEDVPRVVRRVTLSGTGAPAARENLYADPLRPALEDEEDSSTIRPRDPVGAAASWQTSIPNRKATLEVATPRTTNSPSLAYLAEGEGEADYSDLVQDEKDADVLQTRIKEYQVRLTYPLSLAPSFGRH